MDVETGFTELRRLSCKYCFYSGLSNNSLNYSYLFLMGFYALFLDFANQN